MTAVLAQFFTQFHFLRPLWLLMLLPCGILIILLWRQNKHRGSWSKIIAPNLLTSLLDENKNKSLYRPFFLVLAGWCIAVFSLAGPAWKKLPVPINKNQRPWVVVVDLSYHMYATDILPNRMTKVLFKLQDLFTHRREGLFALVAYAESAHTVAPLTDDSHTLNNLVKALAPEIMPTQGNNPATAIGLAKKLLINSGYNQGDILLVTGSMTPHQAKQISDLLKPSNIRLSILGIGTRQGSPIKLPDGSYLKDPQGTIIVPQLEHLQLQSLASANGGHYQTMTVTNDDLNFLLPTDTLNSLLNEDIQRDREFDQWHDAGYWLVWLLLPISLLGFRRGWLILIMVTLLPWTRDVTAYTWNDLWLTRDQQGQKALEAGDAELAARLFSDPIWKAEALFQNQQFIQSADTLNDLNNHKIDPVLAYNRGNALAKAGEFQEAIKAYDQALSQNPNMENARFNRNLIAQLLNQQSQQNQTEQNKPHQESQNETEQHNDTNSAQNDSQSNSKNKNQSELSKSENNQTDGEEEHLQQNTLSQQPDNDSQTDQHQEHNPQQPEQNSSSDHTQQVSQTKEKINENGVENVTQASNNHSDETTLSPEQQTIEIWLRSIPDDPGGLLRRKFRQQQSRELQN